MEIKGWILTAMISYHGKCGLTLDLLFLFLPFFNKKVVNDKGRKEKKVIHGSKISKLFI